MLKNGTRVILDGKRNHRLNGLKGTIKSTETHGIGRIKYYRIHKIETLHPGTSLLYKVGQVIPAEK